MQSIPRQRLSSRAAPVATCRICSASMEITSETAASLSAELRQFMDVHRHAGVADLVIDIRNT